MSNEHKYGDLDEVIEAARELWADIDTLDDIPDTETNREIVEEGLFWCGVNMVRFTYPNERVIEWFKAFKCLQQKWREQKEET